MLRKFKIHLFYDLITVLFCSFITYGILGNLFNSLKYFLINLGIIIIFLLINFYERSRKISFQKKTFIIIFYACFFIPFKIFFFNKEFYFLNLIYIDFVLLVLLISPRFFLNMSEIKINFVKDYNKSKKQILVIGGLGYIGTHLVSKLLNEGKNVAVLDCRMYGNNALIEFSKFKNFNFIEGYASDIIKLSKLMRDSLQVVHLAGLVGDPACSLNEKDTKYFNIKTTNIIKNLCYEFDIQRMIFASSCSVYGNNNEICDENTKPTPVSLYASTKKDSEIELLESKIDTKVLRFSTIFGPSMRLRFDLVVNLFIAQAFYNKNITVFGGDQKRPFLHVADAASSVYNFLNINKNIEKQDIYNVGFDKLNFTIKEVAEIIKSHFQGTTITYSDDNQDKRNYHVSFKKYNSLFPNLNNFQIQDGIQQFTELFKNKEINYQKSIYSNFLTTKEFLNKQNYNIDHLNDFK